MSLLKQLQSQTNQLADSGFKGASGGTDGLIGSVYIPIKVNFGGGELRIYLEFPAEVLRDSATFFATLQELDGMYDLAVFKKSYGNNNGGGGFKNNYNGGGGGQGGYNNNYRQNNYNNNRRY